MRRTVVVGAGLAGLLSAVDRRRRGEDVVVFEAAETMGGVAGVVERNGHRLPTAVSTLRLPDPTLDPILTEAEIETTPVTTSRRFVADGELRPLVPGPGLITTDLVGSTAKMRALLEPVIVGSVGEDPPVGELMRARLGREVGDLAATLMTRGVFAGDPDDLSAKAAFPDLVGGSLFLGALRGRSGRRSSHVPVGGVGSLIRGLAAAAGEVRLGTEVQAVTRHGNRWRVGTATGTEIADRVILAVPPPVAGGLLTEPGPVGERWDPLPVVVVGLAGTADDIPYPGGFGFLSGPAHRGPVLGCIFESDVDPTSALPGRRLLRVLAGGALAPDLVDHDDAEIVEAVVSGLLGLTGTEIHHDFSIVVRQRPGIPQYRTGHSDWLGAVRDWVRRYPGLDLAGWGYRGVGVASLTSITSNESAR